MTALPLTLTAELVALVERAVPDSGPRPGVAYHKDEDYDAVVAGLLAHRPSELWVFAYGSLIWQPAFTFIRQERATAHGWHRAFCLKLTRWRASPEQPGLMMALDRGGCCNGMIYLLPEGGHRQQLGRLMRREMSEKPATNLPRWITVRTPLGRLDALAFVADPKGMDYLGKRPVAETAHILARAAGHLGSAAEYLFQTVSHLQQLGIHDKNLWHLQHLVAEEITGMMAPATSARRAAAAGSRESRPSTVWLRRTGQSGPDQPDRAFTQHSVSRDSR
jgi:glutathione-specific gamma-glutamylcyclotransferase